MRVAVLWPRSRKARWQAGRTDPANFPDQADAFLHLEEEGFQVTLEDSLGLPWNPFARHHEFYSALDPLRAMRVAWRARRYDVAACMGDASAYFLVRLRSLGVRLPIVAIDPALSNDYPRRKRLQDYVLPRVERVVGYAQSQIDYLHEQYGDRVHSVRINHRVDTDFYHPGPAPTAPEYPYVFSIGNDYSRDWETMFQAVSLCAARPGFAHRFRIHTTKPVPEHGPHAEVIRESVTFSQMRDLYRKASVVVVALRDVIHPGGITTLLEAMATGRPVVVTSSRGVSDHLADGETCLVVPPGNPRALADAINRLLDSPQEAARLGANARTYAVETCHNRVFARSLAAVLRDAVESKSRPTSAKPEKVAAS